MSRTSPRRPRRQRSSPRPSTPELASELHEASAGPERLQKLLAAAGLGSRRKCEELITTGRVEVDRKVVTNLGAKADLQVHEIRVDGVRLPQAKLLHYVVNKPTGVVCTNSDPAGRPRVVDLLPDRGQRLFTVGRLDMHSEGLILLTNDGELANRLAHPRYGVQKTYIVEVAGHIEPEELAKITKGVHLSEGFAKVVGARIKSAHKTSSTLEIVLDEGRNREIRRLLARVGHKVQRLKRIALGPLRLGELPVGAVRPLTREERRLLREAASGRAAAKRHQRRPGRKEWAQAAGAAQQVERLQATQNDAAPARPVEREIKPASLAAPARSAEKNSLGPGRVRTVIGGAPGPELSPRKAARPTAVKGGKAAGPRRPIGRGAKPARPGKAALPGKAFRPGKQTGSGKQAGPQKSVVGRGAESAGEGGRRKAGKPGHGRTKFGGGKKQRRPN